MQPLQKGVQIRKTIAACRGADRLRKLTNRRVGLCQRRIAQEQTWRKPLDGAAHHAIGVLRLHLAVNLNAQLAERPVGGEHVRDIAERVLVRGKPRVGRHVDAPAHDVLAFVIARGDAQHLNRARGRRVIAADHAVGDAKAHDGRQRTDDRRQMEHRRGKLDCLPSSVVCRLSSVTSGIAARPQCRAGYCPR